MKFGAKLIQISISTVTLSLCLLLTAAAAESQTGIVTENGLRLRAAPSTNSSILAKATKGSFVSVLSALDSDWYQVSYQGKEGYMSSQYVSLPQQPEPTYANVNTGTASLNIRSGPGTSYAIVKSVKSGTVMPILSVNGNWYEVSCGDIKGYVCGDYIKVLNKEEAAAEGQDKATSDQDKPSTDQDQSADQNNTEDLEKVTIDPNIPLGEQIAAYAQHYLGYPYVYGTKGPSTFDCSGFTSYIYDKFGYNLNRVSYDQVKNGTEVSKSELAPGDLIFFKCNGTPSISHVGIYIGDGQFIHASTNEYSVRIDSIDSNYYSAAYASACRVIGNSESA